MAAARIVTRHLTGDRSNPASITEGCVVASKLHSDLLNGRYNFTRFDSQPHASAPNGFADPTGVGGDINWARYRSGLTSHYHVKGTQTLLAPLQELTGKGLEVSQDQTAADGIEHVFGSNSTAAGAAVSGAFSFVVGTDPGFSARLKFRITAITAITELCFGWRKNAAFSATLNYSDFAVISVAGTPATVNVKTNLASAGIVTTATGKVWAADETHTLEVRVLGTRAVYLFDNAPIAGMPQFDFAAAALLEPVFFLIQGATPTTIFWQESEIGPRRQLTTNLSTQG
jgi:hypothetical protein